MRYWLKIANFFEADVPAEWFPLECVKALGLKKTIE